MQNMAYIEKIRKFNRFYANLLGKIDQEIYSPAYPLTEARVLSEINARKGATATEIREKLGIDRGHMSRIVQKFEEDHLVIRQQSANDKRQLMLKLTPQGQAVQEKLVQNANEGVSRMVEPLEKTALGALTHAMETVQQLLQTEPRGPVQVKIRPFGPGDAGFIAHLHGKIYAETYQFSELFEYYVMKGLTEFMQERDGGELWIAEVDGEIAGSIAIAKTSADTAQLRWFILDERFQGLGIGKALMDTAMGFCKEQQYRHVFLWTVNILETARYLYRKYGFRLTEEKPNSSWTPVEVLEERWDLEMAGGA
jgi:DNA-binding MarR family transcriptional regulator/GNAT superfamily N-acetyltransferase